MRTRTQTGRRWSMVALVLLALLGIAQPSTAREVEAGIGSDLTRWVQQTYEAARERLEGGRERDAKVWLMQEKQKAEVQAIKECEGAVDLRAKIACIERRSASFTEKYRRRAPPEELRFAVLAELQSRLDRATPRPASGSGMALVQRVTAQCSSAAVPRGEQAKCLQHAQDCVRIGSRDPAASTSCLQALEKLIASAGASSAAPSAKRSPKGGECAIFDDPVQSDALAQRDPQRHLTLLMECQQQ